MSAGLEKASAALQQCRRFDGQRFVEEVIPGAMSWASAARLGGLRRGQSGVLATWTCVERLRPARAAALPRRNR